MSFDNREAVLTEARTMAEFAGILPWGSEAQVDADVAFYAALENLLTHAQWLDLEEYALKATTREAIDYAFQLLGVPGPSWTEPQLDCNDASLSDAGG